MSALACPPWCEVRHIDPLEPFHTGPTLGCVKGVYPSDDTTASVSGGKVDPFDVVVELSLSNDGLTLTPAQARQVARALLAAADWADDHRDD
jgi:hypothetical protein